MDDRKEAKLNRPGLALVLAAGVAAAAAVAVVVCVCGVRGVCVLCKEGEVGEEEGKDRLPLIIILFFNCSGDGKLTLLLPNNRVGVLSTGGKGVVGGGGVYIKSPSILTNICAIVSC